ncbi:Por secretion system C-terminal sorting domain-containing protein [Saccharicrinis carchari]|uniref:Por secretion system C-terminal sorting domain-containing protein n=1 Tax=Saccharicrinis carchari TaxID=1168039 RepID=A0A521AZS7_SACCC|nr:T9SS type A sorting domain-containing protein [Saccharicrinis carchari]SMO40295.1 Por secretion system C-terminal sorting domain-containing protein [Saccharicrinis carchari]
MRKIYFLIVMTLMSFGVYAQNVVNDGDMSNATAWNINNIVNDPGKETTVSFNNSVMTISATNGGGNAGTNVMVWQTVQLEAGVEYQLNARIKGNLPVEAFWCQWFVHKSVPVDGEDYLQENDAIVQVNTWQGCASGYNMDTYLQSWPCADFKTIQFAEGGAYTLGVKVGIWNGGVLSYQVELDDFSLTPSATGIKTRNAANIQLYPNPAKTELGINTPTSIKSVSILNLTGQEVLRANKVEGKISVASLPSGIYVIQITNVNNEKSVLKFVKE